MNGFDYGYNYADDIWSEFDTSAIAGVAGVLIGILVVILLLILALGVVMYVLSSLGTYRIAKRRGIHNPWLAWIPVGNLWILGSISDQYQYLVKGKIRNRRTVLICLSAGAYLVSGVVSAIDAVLTFGVGGFGVLAAGGMLLLSLFMMVVSIVLLVFQYMALYDLYASCKPESAEIFLVLSIIFNITQPFFVFACRNKDGGMPPRKPQTQEQPVLQIQEAEVVAPAQEAEETVPCQEPEVIQPEEAPAVEVVAEEPVIEQEAGAVEEPSE